MIRHAPLSFPWLDHLRPDGVWLRRFARTVWERRTAHFGEARRPLVDAQQVFRAVVEACARYRVDGGSPPGALRWSGDGIALRVLQPADTRSVGRLLPREADRSFAAYDRRLARRPAYLLQVGQLQAVDALLWRRLRVFLPALFGVVGVPTGYTWCDAYVGRYGSTPSGVHIDGASNFAFGIHGTKTLYLWEPDFHQRHMRGKAGYRDFIDDAVTLTVRPGEAIYWPSRLWHVAEPGPGLSVTLNVAIYGDARPLDSARQLLAWQLGQTRGSPEHRPTVPGHRERIRGFSRDESLLSLPTEFERACRSLLGDRPADGVLAEAARRWRRRVENLAFLHPYRRSVRTAHEVAR